MTPDCGGVTIESLYDGGGDGDDRESGRCERGVSCWCWGLVLECDGGVIVYDGGRRRPSRGSADGPPEEI